MQVPLAEGIGNVSVRTARGRFFFFQAEDGIRDYKVTGVQTCALPISTLDPRNPPPMKRLLLAVVLVSLYLLAALPAVAQPLAGPVPLTQGGKGGALKIGRASCRERV